MGKMSRDKGQRGEREVVHFLRDHGFEARRGQQHRGGPGSPDVIHSIPNLHIEVKFTERFSLYPAMDQADEDAGDGEVPVVFHRRNSERWVVIMDASDFLRVMKEINR